MVLWVKLRMSITKFADGTSIRSSAILPLAVVGAGLLVNAAWVVFIGYCIYKLVWFVQRTTVPGGSGIFIGFGNVATSNGAVAFEGFSLSDAGIYSNQGGVLGLVIDLSDVLAGKSIAALSLSQFGFDGQIAFRATFSDGSEGIFIATTAAPLPAALPLFATSVGALGLLGGRRKRKAAVALESARKR
jgi:hypothetical protein